MKNIRYALVGMLVLILFMGSCTIEKRVHLPGYHVEWSHSSGKRMIADELPTFARADEFSNGKLVSIPADEISVSSDAALVFPELKQSSVSLLKQVNVEDCDIIIFQNGSEVRAKVLEVGVYEVKYLDCENLSGPVFVKLKSEVFMIRYANGSNTVITDPVKQPNNQSISTTVNIDILPPAGADNPNDRNYAVAVILWFFLGLIGIHRFYLGHIGMGILYALTAGLCGIGWIVDGILLLTGELKPRGGDFY